MKVWRAELSGRSKRSVIVKKPPRVTARKLIEILTTPSRSPNHQRVILGHWLTSTGVFFSQLLERITPGQRPVLCSYLREPNDRCVARQLGLRESTVRNHMSLIETKLNAESREHLIAMCMAALIREALTHSQID